MPMIRRLVALSFCCAVSAPALALDEGPTFDCADPASQAEEAVCASPDLAALDRELARLYDLAVQDPALSGERLDELRAMQRGWIKGRDACWSSDLGLPTCVRNAYALRIHGLRGRYDGARAEPGPSTGPFPYVCDGTPALVSASFTQSGTPLAILTWTEGFAVLPLIPAASGARYGEGETEFWTKGDEATLTLRGQAPSTCQRDDMG
ncbi:MAG TPA: hypothetical protein DEA05_08130 [Rhodobacteraceae bacterium]|nr:hypothetical protein [Paracoccaceae bacterium]